MTIADMVGSLGVALLLGAFMLNLIGKLGNKSAVYISINAVGAGIAAYASYMIAYWPFVVLEGVWCLVSSIALIRYFNELGKPGSPA